MHPDNREDVDLMLTDFTAWSEEHEKKQTDERTQALLAAGGEIG